MQAADAKSDVSSINLEKQKLTMVPEHVFQFSALRQLLLGDNQLRFLPASIGRLSSLEVLGLEKNQLTSLPAELAALTNLKELTLHDNNLQRLPDVVCAIKSLTNLTLDRNPMLFLPDAICGLTRLTRLHLDEMCLTELPEGLADLPALTDLGIGFNPHLLVLPSSFARLRAFLWFEALHSVRNVPADVLSKGGPAAIEFLAKNPRTESASASVSVSLCDPVLPACLCSCAHAVSIITDYLQSCVAYSDSTRQSVELTRPSFRAFWYCCDGVNDSGWGCGWRCLQMLAWQLICRLPPDLTLTHALTHELTLPLSLSPPLPLSLSPARERERTAHIPTLFEIATQMAKYGCEDLVVLKDPSRGPKTSYKLPFLDARWAAAWFAHFAHKFCFRFNSSEETEKPRCVIFNIDSPSKISELFSTLKRNLLNQRLLSLLFANGFVVAIAGVHTLTTDTHDTDTHSSSTHPMHAINNFRVLVVDPHVWDVHNNADTRNLAFVPEDKRPSFPEHLRGVAKGGCGWTDVLSLLIAPAVEAGVFASKEQALADLDNALTLLSPSVLLFEMSLAAPGP